MRDDVQAVHGGNARPLTVGQTKAAPDALLNQRARVRGAERNDCVEVGDVPTFFQHVDVNDNLDGIVIALDGQKLLDRLFLLHAGIDLNDFSGVAALVEVTGLDEGHQVSCVRSVACDY